MPLPPSFRQIRACRCCGNRELVEVFSLGLQSLTGVFPRSVDESVSQGPLDLVKCHSEKGCGLLQLRNSFNAAEMYGCNYGYRSSLNQSMVSHLEDKVKSLLARQQLQPGDVVLDIGSNDGTLLSFMPSQAKRIGMDPTIAKFREFYDPDITAVSDFFSKNSFFQHSSTKARLVTSIAMFYDLESPSSFMEEIESVLADDGIWHFEQSYLPTMLEQNAYDTICHEHLEYYALSQIEWMASRCGLRILDVELNRINGGSFAITACKRNAKYESNQRNVDRVREHERSLGLDELPVFEQFKKRVFAHREHLQKTISKLADAGSSVLGYGASTKGNVILQFCGFNSSNISAIAEINEDKFGSYTPGTRIPIISEQEAQARNPDYFLVLPWHFRSNILERESAFIQAGGRMIFPLPEIEVFP